MDSQFDQVIRGTDGRLYELCFDSLGRCLWINAEDGSSVARFNTTTGVDLHNTVTDQLKGAPECLWCTHGKPDYATWSEFVLQVRERSGLDLSIDAIDVGLLA